MRFFEEKRREVMKHIEVFMLEKITEYLKPVDTIWQPSDFLPDSTRETFFSEIKELQESASGLSYDLISVLIGDPITEEALPTYEPWLTMVEGVSRDEEGGWSKSACGRSSLGSSERNMINKYLFLSGRVNM